MSVHRPHPGFRRTLLAQAVLVSLFAMPMAHADGTTDLGSVQAGGGSSATTTAARKQLSAPAQAVSQGSLVATQPQSIISQHVIENTAAPSANYTDIVSISPSVMDIEPNGPGLAEAGQNAVGGPSIRGFVDGQYNVTFDGIPWGDSNDFTHHSTVYFMPQDLGQVVVDRGPGDASNIGPATFGGTIDSVSKEPLDDPRTTIYGSVGSWNTDMIGAEFDTGIMKNYGDARAFFDYRHLTSDGYLSGASFRRSNLFVKVEKPVADDSLLTFVAMKNDTLQHVSWGATSAPYADPNNPSTPSTVPGQMQVLGDNYGFYPSQQSMSWAGYNYDDLSTDFEYVGLKTHAGDLKIDNKLYTYAYYHVGYNGADVNGGNCVYGAQTCPAGTTGTGTIATGQALNADGSVPLTQMYNNYRSWGDLLRTELPLGEGTLKSGMWIDDQGNDRWGTGASTSAGVYPLDHLMHDTLLQFQPYVEYAWKATSQITVTPGVKDAYFRRSMNAVLDGHGHSNNYTDSWNRLLPSIDVHDAINRHWSAYAQAAAGFLAPNLKYFYTANPALSTSNLQPQQTQSYQLGTTWKSDTFTLAGDVYRVNNNNAVTKATVIGGTAWVNQGKAYFQGGEVEGTYYLGGGFSVYGNASYNEAIDDTVGDATYGKQLAGIPKNTEALGLIYNVGPWYASLVTKFVGARNGDYNGATPIYPFAPVALTNVAVNYTSQGDAMLPKGAKIGLQVDNLTNESALYALAGYTGASGMPLFYTPAGRSVSLNFSYPFN